MPGAATVQGGARVPTTAKRDAARVVELFAQLVAYARNIGSGSLERTLLELAELVEVKVSEDAINERRKA